MVVKIGGKRMYLWRAVDDEGEVLDLVVQRRRDTEAALRLLRRLLHNQPVEPQTITTDGLASYGAALDVLDLRHLHRPGRLRENNRVENSHLLIRRRERQQQRPPRHNHALVQRKAVSQERGFSVRVPPIGRPSVSQTCPSKEWV